MAVAPIREQGSSMVKEGLKGLADPKNEPNFLLLNQQSI